MTPNLALFYITHGSMLVTTQYDARVDSDSILAFGRKYWNERWIFLLITNFMQYNARSSVNTVNPPQGSVKKQTYPTCTYTYVHCRL